MSISKIPNHVQYLDDISIAIHMNELHTGKHMPKGIDDDMYLVTN